MKSKYEKAVLPSKVEALKRAMEYDLWAEDAKSRDKFGSAHEFELMALLLRFYADRLAHHDC